MWHGWLLIVIGYLLIRIVEANCSSSAGGLFDQPTFPWAIGCAGEHGGGRITLMTCRRVPVADYARPGGAGLVMPGGALAIR